VRVSVTFGYGIGFGVRVMELDPSRRLGPRLVPILYKLKVVSKSQVPIRSSVQLDCRSNYLDPILDLGFRGWNPRSSISESDLESSLAKGQVSRSLVLGPKLVHSHGPHLGSKPAGCDSWPGCTNSDRITDQRHGSGFSSSFGVTGQDAGSQDSKSRNMDSMSRMQFH
uniref:Uncharacterized protein n=1 Tax=Cannabis sativa TaxID=3483 RepID=A0A803QRY5_CANSA